VDRWPCGFAQRAQNERKRGGPLLAIDQAVLGTTTSRIVISPAARCRTPGGIGAAPPGPTATRSQDDPPAPLRGESAVLQNWRQRMAGPIGQLIYRQRAASIECVNAQARNRGLQQFRVRGPTKARTTGLWYALAHNLMRAFRLLPVSPT
jgi:hypothetical protein